MTTTQTTAPAPTGTSANRTKGDGFASFDVEAFEVPTVKDENWRFTPLRRLRGLHDGTAGNGGDADGSVTYTLDEVIGGTGAFSLEIVGRDDARLGEAGVPSDRVAAQAWRGFTRAAVLDVPADADLGAAEDAAPLVLTVTGPGAGLTAYGHLLVRLGTHARAVLVIDQRGSGTYAENVEFHLADGADLTVVLIQDWEADAVHLAAHHISLGRDARIRHTNVTFGGELVRIVPETTFRAPGGDAELLGLYYADAGQHLELRLLVDHAVPNCRSNVLYKGALQGVPDGSAPDAHAVWVGDVLIRAAAEGTDTYEVNRNLVLTDGARADSVPNLEIETGRIAGAGHASATGRFDDEQLFYLCSRGIPEDLARRLVVRGFFGEIIARIPVPQVRDRLEAAVEAELEIAGV